MVFLTQKKGARGFGAGQAAGEPNDYEPPKARTPPIKCLHQGKAREKKVGKGSVFLRYKSRGGL